jgi:hypothetical protein
MIQEEFLHFVWLHQYFNPKQLITTDGKSVEVLKPGYHNHLAGPDFKEASIKLEGILWAGSVEIHVKSSDWSAHKHDGDSNYDNVVLHVVFTHDREILNADGQPIPTLELKGLVKPGLLSRYKTIVESQTDIPCDNSFHKVKAVTKLSMLEFALVRRLERKGDLFKEILESNNQDWEQSTYQWLASGFGFKTNSENMLQLANAVPLKVLQKHADLKQWEALLFGASGLLNASDNDAYANELRREYAFLERKYEVKSSLNYNQWHFSGVRPSNFPTLRIAQFAALVHSHPNLFSLFTHFTDLVSLQNLLQVSQSEYWKTHLNFGAKSKFQNKAMSKSAAQGLMINTIAPLLVAYSEYKDDADMLDRAMNILMTLPVEQNHIIRKWQSLGWNVNSSFDTQGLIELHNEYCLTRKCMKCKIGIELVKA